MKDRDPPTSTVVLPQGCGLDKYTHVHAYQLCGNAAYLDITTLLPFFPPLAMRGLDDKTAFPPPPTISMVEIYQIISVYFFLSNLENRNYARNYFSIVFRIMS